MSHRYPLPGPHSYLLIRGHALEFYYGDLVADPRRPFCWMAGGLNAAGQTQLHAWITALFYDAEHVRHLSRRCRMSALWGSGSGFVRFPRAYRSEDIAQWVETLLRILREPAYLRTLDTADVT